MPNFGKDDNLDNATSPTDKSDQFDLLYDLWFYKIPANRALLDSAGKLKDVKESFEAGGWYEFPLSDKISVLSLNSVYWNTNKLNSTAYPDYFTDSGPPAVQLSWLRKVFYHNSLLPKSERRHYILSMGIPPGFNYYPRSETPF